MTSDRRHGLAVNATRLAVTAAVISGAFALAGATAGRGTAARVTGLSESWICWGMMIVAALVPSVISLTALRLLAPVHLAGTAAIWIAGAGVARAVPAVVIAMALVAVTFSADTGRAFVQASAYGEEARFPLRVPAPYLAPLVIAWVVWAAAVLAGALLTAAWRPVIGAPLLAASVAVGWFLWPRWHRFAQRWLVRVPAGVVVHDPVMLGETVMVPARNVRGAELAREGTEALDLSGPAAGHLIEIRLGDLVTMLVRQTAGGTAAVHVRSFLIAPSRPGAALAALTGT